ncbi:tape measure protein [Arthrobacter phage Atraxa]|uniref:Tape measure protein n=1 Tax=Arthrobacter phage Atraxa TaxID=2419947 RepID=A0A3G2KDI9_9CAUD|nr:tail length tape measure protein [Arthrobacter phage Atraxa]AYN56965.1 tape measure protein [Arthrobacter phage Atraxa]AYN59073.1 tape measure protein [Arthrobacter phage Sputnik]
MAKSAIMSLRIVADAKNAVQGIDSTRASVGKFLKVAGAAAIAAAGAALVKYGLEAVNMAGDLQQSQGAIDTVFGKSAGTMHKWAKGAAQDVGLAANEYNELGTLIGTQLKNGGTAMDQLGPKTNNLIKLGADLSSMFGGTSADAVGALSSALKGERDPIEKYGVSLNQAKIDAEAAALGFKKAGGALSTEANQAATLSLIMKQTSDAHGNFAKESNTLQGQQQRVAAEFANIKATIGTAFLPAMTAVFSFINTNVIPVIQGLVSNLGEGGGAFSALGPAIAAAMSVLSPMQVIWAALVPLLPQITGMFQTLAAAVIPALTQVFAAVIPVIEAVIGAVAPLIATIATMLIPIITTLATAVIPPVIAGFAAIIAAILPVVTTIIGLLVPVINSLLSVVQTVFKLIGIYIQTAMGVIQGVIKTVTAIIKGDWSGAWEGIKQIFVTIVGSIGSFAATFFGELPGKILAALGDVGGLLLGAGKAILKGFLDGLKAGWGAVTDFVGGIADWIAKNKGPISYDKRLLQPAGKAIMGGLVKSMRAGMPDLKRTVSAVTRTIGGVEASPKVNLDVSGKGSSGGSSGGRVIKVIVNFNGLVTDKVGTAREIRRVLQDADLLTGRAV